MVIVNVMLPVKQSQSCYHYQDKKIVHITDDVLENAKSLE